ncbi:MAG: hypothetical protein NT049_08965 [Planctomycetota bacterium]|nr:hypothetical protein [Planctomycetota bacterium]
MDGYGKALMLAILVFSELTVIIIVLLALPRSRTRGIALQVVGWCLFVNFIACALLCVAALQNILGYDYAPSYMIPMFDWVYGLGALVAALFGGVGAAITAVVGVVLIVMGRNDLRQLQGQVEVRKIDE